MNTISPKPHPAEGQTTLGDIIVGVVGCIGAIWLIVDAIHSIWRMYP